MPVHQDAKLTWRAHWKQIERATGKPRPELHGPELPDLLDHVWQWFLDLHAGRGGNGFSANPITYSELAAWAALAGTAPTAFEVEAIRALDRAWFEVSAASTTTTEEADE